jgi:type IV secretory pathway VirB10-like protein
MNDVDGGVDSELGTSKDGAADGLVPPFLKKHVLNPQLGLAMLALGAVASLPLWHFHGPDVGHLASAVHFGGSVADAATADEKKEAPDPSPTPFPRRHQAARADAAGTRTAPGTGSNVAAVRNFGFVEAETSGTRATAMSMGTSNSPTPEPPTVTRGTFGDPVGPSPGSDISLDATAAVTGRRATHSVVSNGSAAHGADQDSQGLGYVPAVSRSELSEGAVIHCRWITHVDSEHPGHVTGEVVEPVYSTIDPEVEVVPAGAQVQGWYRTADSGDTRLFVAWDRINFPDGRKFQMGEEPGTDELGGTGIGGSVNTHLGKLLGQALLYTALNSAGQSLTHAFDTSSSITQSFSDRQPQVKPTIYIDPPARFDVNVVRDLPLDAYEVSK